MILKEDEEVTDEDKIIIFGDESLEDIQDSTKDDDVLPSETTIIKELFEEEPEETKLVLETKSDDEEIRLKHSGDSNWIQKFLKNKYYSIEDNEGGGDCLFAVIRDAYASIGKKLTVLDLRSIIAREATQEYFEHTKIMYDELYNAYTTTKKEMKELVNKNKDIKEKVTAKVNKKKKTNGKKETVHLVSKLGREEKKKLIDQSKIIQKKWSRLKDENEATKQLMTEYRLLWKVLHHSMNFVKSLKRVNFGEKRGQFLHWNEY